jgi:TonB-linked SusC/RagA family outer membrane protein
MRKFLTLLAVLVLLGSLAFSQSRVVTGKVTDQAGQPVPFATITIKGTKIGTSADGDGKFSIKADPSQTLIISGAGVTTKEVAVGSSSELAIEVIHSTTNLSEVVVTALGQNRSKNSTPYATQQISGDNLTKTVTTNVVDNLSGKIAGLTVTASNAMGGSSNTVLRGFRSLTQSNQALFVVDGVPYDNSIVTGGGYDFGSAASDLNPDDIASVNVLKGAAASALYGSRGANGVILITTKKGVSRKGVGVTASFGISAGSPDNSTLPTYQTTYGQGYGNTAAEGFAYESVPWTPTSDPITIAYTGGDAATGPVYDGSQVYNWDAFAPNDPNFHKSTTWAPAANHNPQDYFVTPITTTEAVLVQGGGDKGTFKFGYTRDDEGGYIPNSVIRKNLFDLDATYNLARNITFDAGLLYVNENATNRYLYQYTGGTNPMTDFRQWWPTNVDIKQQKADYFNGLTNETWNWQDDGSYQNNKAGSIGLPAYHDNLYWFAYQNYEQDSRNRYTSRARLNWNFTDYLSFTGSVTSDYYFQNIQQRNNIGSQAVSFYTTQNTTFSETNYNGIINFHKNFGENFSVKALLGGNIQNDENPSTFSSTNGGLVIPGFWSISNSAKTPAAPTETDYRKEINSLYGGITLSYKDMITLDGTLRRDQTSTLPAENNTYYYPSISGNFIFSKLLTQANWLSYGKFWANYAEVGNDAPYYSVYNTYQINTPILGQALMSNKAYNTAGAIANNNLNLVPEQNKAYEFGIEADFIDNRVGVNVTYYHSLQNNEILPINVSTATGYNRYYVNGGSVQNQGWEVTLHLVPIRTHDFNWDIGVNWSKNENKVLSLYGGQPSFAIGTYQNSISLVAEVGKPYGIIRGSDYNYLNGQRVVDNNGYWEKNSLGQNADIGSIQPDWIGGITNSFTYKNWAFSFLIDVHQGGQVYSLDMDYGSYSGLYPRTATINANGKNVRAPVADGGGTILNGVTEDGKKNTTVIGEDVTSFWTYGSGFGTGAETNKEFVYSASFVKLREVALTYSLPQKAIQGLKYINGINLSLSGRNLWIIHKDLPYADPEQGQAAGNGSIGFQNGAYPTMRTMSFIVKVTF